MLYAWSASFGPRFWREEKVIFHYHIWKIDSFKNFDKNFLYHFLDLDSAKIKNEVQGGTMVHITKGDMEKRTISYPSVPEQRNIARFLFLLDERIATQNKIIEDLKKLKSAIIEKHYSQVKKRTTCIADLGEPFSVGSLAKDDLTEIGSPCVGSPDKSGGEFFNSIENLYLCTMNNQGLLALAQLILPSEILSNFEVVRVEEEASLIRIYLDESVKAEYKENPEIESKGFCEAVTIRDFPIRDKGVDLIVRRRKWYDKQNNRYFSDFYDLKAEETRYSKEFAAFLKGVYGDDSYDLPFA